MNDKAWRNYKQMVKENYEAESLAQEERHKSDQVETKKRMEELALTGKVTNQNPTKLSTKLFAWGVDSKKHPTVSMGIFPMILMWLFVVPILAVLYKMSFGWLPISLIVAAASLVNLARWIMRK